MFNFETMMNSTIDFVESCQSWKIFGDAEIYVLMSGFFSELIVGKALVHI